MLTVVEKVLFLQDADIFENTSTEDLAYIAAITEEVHHQAGSTIFQENEASDSMYLVVEGKVRLHRGDQEVMVAKDKDAFGTWALFDDRARIVTATALEDSLLLRIDREEFFDLLTDHSRITQAMMKTLSRRLRNIIGRVGIDPGSKK
jgi:CRP/FNR family cyclic AMP-dependent transcriptional regulator